MTGKNIWRLCKVYGRLIGFPELKPMTYGMGVAMESTGGITTWSMSKGSSSTPGIVRPRALTATRSSLFLSCPRGRQR
jgi:hypothetical protein